MTFEPLLSLIAAAIAASIAYLVELSHRSERLRAWRRAAARVGLTGVEESEGGAFTSGFLRGRAGEILVQLERYRRGRYEHGTRILVSGLGHGPGGLSLRREGLGTAIEKRFIGEREIEIGDASFDDEFFVQGRAPLAIALLGCDTRSRVAALLRNRIRLEHGAWVDVEASLTDGALNVKVKESGFSGNRERIPHVLAAVLEVARRLVAPDDVAARIAENLRSESSVGVRVQSLRVLAREFPSHPATREALLAACQDPSEEVRLRAGITLGDDGRGTLLALVNGAQTRDSCAAQAISALGKSLPGEQAKAALRRALGEPGRAQTAQACLEALGLLGRAEAEGIMLRALRSEDGAVTVAAARALGRAGTVAAVPALREIAEAGGEVRRAARQAVAEIQARLTGAEPGQLSLSGGEAGALSLADNAGAPGRLSLAEEGAPIADREEGSPDAGAKSQPKRAAEPTK